MYSINICCRKVIKSLIGYSLILENPSQLGILIGTDFLTLLELTLIITRAFGYYAIPGTFSPHCVMSRVIGYDIYISRKDVSTLIFVWGPYPKFPLNLSIIDYIKFMVEN